MTLGSCLCEQQVVCDEAWRLNTAATLSSYLCCALPRVWMAPWDLPKWWRAWIPIWLDWNWHPKKRINSYVEVLLLLHSVLQFLNVRRRQWKLMRVFRYERIPRYCFLIAPLIKDFPSIVLITPLVEDFTLFISLLREQRGWDRKGWDSWMEGAPLCVCGGGQVKGGEKVKDWVNGGCACKTDKKQRARGGRGRNQKSKGGNAIFYAKCS